MKKNICVFCSSSDVIDRVYFEAAEKLALKIAENNKTFVFGGSNVGLMRRMAEVISKNNGFSIGIIPQKILDSNLGCKLVDELIVTKDMYTRKAKLADYADAFVALPGGFGTLEELSEVITHKQLAYHNKPIVILNINGFYNNLISFFETLYTEKVAKADYRKIYYLANTVDDAFEYIENYKPEKQVSKWFKKK